MRISDWSSDVCSSDLLACALDRIARRASEAMQRGRITVRARQIRQHRFEHPRIEAGGRVLVEIDRHQNAGCRCRSEEHTSELQSLMRISYAVFCLKKKNNKHNT